MNEFVRKYIETKKAEKRAAFEKERDKKLIELGLYYKKFVPEDDVVNDPNFNYEDTEYDYVDGKNGYSKKIPLEVTDEEYEEILKYSTSNVKKGKREVVSVIIEVIAWATVVAGLFTGCAFLDEFYITAMVWGSTFLSAVGLLSFSKIIDLLSEIRDNTKNK